MIVFLVRDIIEEALKTGLIMKGCFVGINGMPVTTRKRGQILQLKLLLIIVPAKCEGLAVATR